MMMFSGDERVARFVHIVERMQSAEMMDMDYIVRRLTDDDGSIHYSIDIPDKDVLELIKRPSRIVLASPKPTEKALTDWKALMDRMRKPTQEE